jgi:hypothetical protein
MRVFSFVIGLLGMIIMTTPDPAPAAEPKFMDLNTLLMETTFFVEGPSSKEEGKTSGGTVFVLGKPYDESGMVHYVLVTATHVLNDIKGDVATLHFRQRKPDGTYEVSPWPIVIRRANVDLFTRHPEVDVAAMHVRMPQAFTSLSVVSTAHLASDEQLEKYEIHPGDELFCLGFPLFASGNYRFPILRSGKIASYPLVPTARNRAWLFDFRVFGGNSGGPVYFIDRNRRYGNATVIGETIQLVIGLVTSQLLAAPEFNNRELQLGAIVPAPMILETTNRLSKPE